MAVVTEQVEVAPVRVHRGRRRAVLLGVVALVALGVGWAFLRGPGAAVVKRPLVAGSLGGGPHCSSDVRTRSVDDSFGGGGTIMKYVDGGRCEIAFSVRNNARVPVTVLGVERTDPDFVEPLRLVSATRDSVPLSAHQTCYGCAEEYEPFTPMTIAPGDEWEIAVQGVMDHCRPDPPGGGYNQTTRKQIEFDVEIGGINRHVSMRLRSPWAVRHDACSADL